MKTLLLTVVAALVAPESIGNRIHLATDNRIRSEEVCRITEEELEVKYDGGELEIGFNVTYLLDALGAVQGDGIRISLADSNSSCLIDAPGKPEARYVVMPMRL